MTKKCNLLKNKLSCGWVGEWVGGSTKNKANLAFSQVELGLGLSLAIKVGFKNENICHLSLNKCLGNSYFLVISYDFIALILNQSKVDRGLKRCEKYCFDKYCVDNHFMCMLNIIFGPI